MKFGKYLQSSVSPQWQTLCVDYRRLKKILKKILVPEANRTRANDDFLKALGKEREKINNFQEEKCQQIKKALDEAVAQIQERQRDQSIGSRRYLAGLRAHLTGIFHDAERLESYDSLNSLAFYKIIKKYRKTTAHSPFDPQDPLIQEVNAQPFHESKELEGLKRDLAFLFATTFTQGNLGQAQNQLQRRHVFPTAHDEFRFGLQVGIQTTLLGVGLYLVFLRPGGIRLPDLAFTLPMFRGQALMLMLLWLWGALVLRSFARHRINHYYIMELDEATAMSWVGALRVACTLGCLFLGLLLFPTPPSPPTPSLFSHFIHHPSLPSLISLLLPHLPQPPILLRHSPPSSGHPLDPTSDSRVSLFWVLGLESDSLYTIPSQYCFLAMLCALAIFLFCPLHIWEYSTRRWLLRRLGRVALAPWFPVHFADSLVADILTSLVKVVSDWVFSLCFFTSGLAFQPDPLSAVPTSWCTLMAPRYVTPVFMCLPYFWRAMQTLRMFRDTHRWFPHLVNFGKYCFQLTAMISSVLFSVEAGKDAYTWPWSPWGTAWIGVLAVSSVYSFLWDIIMDWGLFRPRSRNCLLRDDLLFQRRSFYWLAILLDLVGRFCWVVTITSQLIFKDTVAVSLFAAGEVFRRAVWCVFRIENECVNNFEHYRHVKYVPRLPVDIVPRSPPPTLIPDVNALTHLHASLCVCASFETLPVRLISPLLHTPPGSGSPNIAHHHPTGGMPHLDLLNFPKRPVMLPTVAATLKVDESVASTPPASSASASTTPGDLAIPTPDTSLPPSSPLYEAEEQRRSEEEQSPPPSPGPEEEETITAANVPGAACVGMELEEIGEVMETAAGDDDAADR
ncbi:putative xenotropic and polytropic retrovirus receptor [Paratrimastix pyriformis]|uniref:Xenotropic and polytropic retrovirus receptor n=1 Tax=Paratrimastix pyriformis TaxID=342808 RepID=A0ABQ8UC58_9EUKA|nr:putative xenotropic and polytropic retrovirus receptor [Paratrimastix pyriformis]